MIINQYLFTLPVNPVFATLVHSYNANNNSNDQRGTAHGTLIGGTNYVTGVIGQAFNGDGINNAVSFPNNSWDVTGDFTCSVWFKQNNVSSNSFPLFIWDGVQGFYIYELGGTYRVVYNSFIYAVIIGSGAFGDVKNHVVVTRIGTENKIYLNGTLINTQTIPSVTASTYNCGLIYNATANNFFYDGWVDTPQFFNTGLSASDVTTLYNGGAGLEF